MRWPKIVSPDERCSWRTAKSCGPDASTPASTSQECFRILRGMVTRKPDHQGEHEASRNTIAQGMPDRFGEPVVTLLVRFFHLRARLRVRQAPGIPCALFRGGASFSQRLGYEVPRERIITALRANGSRECAPDDRLREAIQPSQDTASGLLRRVAPRNDGRGD